MGKYESLASIAGGLNIIAFSSLIFNVYLTHVTHNLTWIWIFSNLIAQSLFFTYGIINQSYGIYIPTAFFIMGLLFILSMKVIGEKETT